MTAFTLLLRPFNDGMGDGAEVGEEVNFLHTNRVQSKPFIKKGPIDGGQGQMEFSLSALFGVWFSLLQGWMKDAGLL